ncbi:YajD family HNH nuclease [Massilia sp. H-1]|nr:YajD family HNH nuclease [Massilia sp. H-1]
MVADARRAADTREQGYRERSLKMYPWICGRCMREFTHANVSQLTVHHRDHNHNNNPPDGSNWELLCLYCHDNEHSRYLEADRGPGLQSESVQPATHNPFAGLSQPDQEAGWELGHEDRPDERANNDADEEKAAAKGQHFHSGFPL